MMNSTPALPHLPPSHRWTTVHGLATALRIGMFALLLCFGASVALAQTRAYVTNTNDNTVSVIDTATRLVTATIPVGLGPAGVAVTPNGRFAYSRINKATVSQ